jgi:hypothetical protein
MGFTPPSHAIDELLRVAPVRAGYGVGAENDFQSRDLHRAMQ